MKITEYNIVLGSNSPRRRELLSGIDIDYQLRVPDEVDESYPSDMPFEDVPVFLAQRKASAGMDSLNEGELLLTADTIVVLEGSVLGKPANMEEVHNMLTCLSGKKHQVITGVCLTSIDNQVSFADITEVTFAELTSEEIAYYGSKYNPIDKAGAYGVQEWIGYIGVDHLNGSYFNVMGLPIHRVYQAIKNFK